MIKLHTVATPNGHKISIALEELGEDYELIEYDISAGDQFRPELLVLNPNNKLPVLVDESPLGGGEPVVVFETGAMLIYLAEKHGRLLAKEGAQRYRQLQWLMFQVSAVGPLQGQAHHYVRYAKIKQDYARQRYLNESRRQCQVLESQLSRHDYIAGEDYSIADIACWPWLRALPLIDIHLQRDFPATQAWFERVAARPGVQRGRDVINGWVYQLPPNFFMELDAQTWSYSFGEEQYKQRQRR